MRSRVYTDRPKERHKPLSGIARVFPCLESFELVNVWKALKADYGHDLTHQQEQRYGCYYKQLLIVPSQV